VIRARLVKPVLVLGGALALLLLPATAAQARVIHVRSTIQRAAARPSQGTSSSVPAGSFHENVVVSTDRISIVALPGAVLDGTGTPGSVGIRVAPVSPTGTLHAFRLQGLRVENYARDGVLLRHVDGFAIVGSSWRSITPSRATKDDRFAGILRERRDSNPRPPA
jgi:nitrous oxidase accessory protein NosD